MLKQQEEEEEEEERAGASDSSSDGEAQWQSDSSSRSVIALPFINMSSAKSFLRLPSMSELSHSNP